MASITVVDQKKLNIELPYTAEGKVDWDTLGKIVTGHILGEVLCASYVDKRHSYMQERDRHVDTAWEFCYEKSGITVLKKRLPNSNTCFMGRGVIDEPMDVVAALYKEVENFYIWDKFLVEACNVKVLSESPSHTDVIRYQRFETSHYCGSLNLKRDMLYYCRSIFTEGKYVQASTSVDYPDFPPLPGVPRMELNLASGFVLEPYCGNRSKTLVSYLVDIDLKHLPKIVMNQVLKRHPLSIRHVREYFETPVHQQKLKLQRQDSSCSSASYTPDITMSSRHYEDPLEVKHFITDSTPGLDSCQSSVSEKDEN